METYIIKIRETLAQHLSFPHSLREAFDDILKRLAVIFRYVVFLRI